MGKECLNETLLARGSTRTWMSKASPTVQRCASGMVIRHTNVIESSIHDKSLDTPRLNAPTTAIRCAVSLTPITLSFTAHHNTQAA